MGSSVTRVFAKSLGMELNYFHLAAHSEPANQMYRCPASSNTTGRLPWPWMKTLAVHAMHWKVGAKLQGSPSTYSSSLTQALERFQNLTEFSGICSFASKCARMSHCGAEKRTHGLL